MNHEKYETEKHDYYLAQLACEVRRSYVKEPTQVKISDFILEFTAKQPAKQAEPSAEDQRERAKRSESAWLAHLGIKTS